MYKIDGCMADRGLSAMEDTDSATIYSQTNLKSKSRVVARAQTRFDLQSTMAHHFQLT